MPEFTDIIHAMSNMQDVFGQIEWDINSDGILTVKAYAGIRNHELHKQARAMFAPAE